MKNSAMAATIRMMEKRLPTKAQIAEQAYQIHLARGGAPGHEMDDWLQAEYELVQLPIRRIAEMAPPQAVTNRTTKSWLKKSALVSLVQAALLAGGSAIR